MPLRNVYILIVATLVCAVSYYHAPRNRYVSTLNEAMNLITDEYLEVVEPRVLFEGAMAGMAAKLDSYSSFSEPTDYQEVKQHLKGEFGGIGILVEMNADTKRITVMSPLVGTPAYKAGLKPGDVILAIDGTDTENLTLKDCVELIHGPVGETIKLSIGRKEQKEPLEFTIARANIKVDSVLGDLRQNDGKWRYHLPEHPEIAYIRLLTFGEDSSEELQQAIEQRAAAGRLQGVIIDLRQNAGGLLDAAVSISDLFLDEGEIVSTRGRDGKRRKTYQATRGTLIADDVPLVILVDRYSASASEILSACLQDHARAVIVGQRTWGKGTVQNLIELPGKRGALRLTVATYWRPSGQNIHKLKDATDDDVWGVRPDPDCDINPTEEQQEKIVRNRRARDAMLIDANLPSQAEVGANDDKPTTPIVDDKSQNERTDSAPKAPGEEPPKLEEPGKVSPLKVDLQLQKAVDLILSKSQANSSP